MKESDMAQIVDWIDAVICSPEDDAVIGRVGEAVRMRMRDLPLFEG
jgi:glycine/serine hydroxymethyltransferase